MLESRDDYRKMKYEFRRTKYLLAKSGQRATGNAITPSKHQKERRR